MVIDSHVLLWWLEDRPELSALAADRLNGAEQSGRQCFVCGGSLWELYRKECCGRLAPKMSIRDWPSLLDRLSWMTVVPTSINVWLLMAELDWHHRDPIDRMIAATALELAVPVLTIDRVFHEAASPVPAVW